MSSSLPSIFVASTWTMSPPASLTTRPVTMPTWSWASSSPYSKRAGPRYSSSSPARTVTLTDASSATRRATFRAMLAISRSRLRTPASFVNAWIRRTMAGSSIVSCSSFRPWASSCFGTRKRWAMRSFSSWV